MDRTVASEDEVGGLVGKKEREGEKVGGREGGRARGREKEREVTNTCLPGYGGASGCASREADGFLKSASWTR